MSVHSIDSTLFQRLCCMCKQKETDDTTIHTQILVIQTLNSELQSQQKEKEAQQQDNRALRDENSALKEKERVRTLTPRLESIYQELRKETASRNQTRTVQAVGITAVTCILGPLFLPAAVVGAVYTSAFVHRKQYFSKEYWDNLKSLESTARTLCVVLKQTYPEDLETAWWNAHPAWRIP